MSAKAFEAESKQPKTPIKRSKSANKKVKRAHRLDSPTKSPGRNISQSILHDHNTFKTQSELYQGTHQGFLFKAAKCKVKSNADRVYRYYHYNDEWRKDRYLRLSQEANNKALMSREGRKLNLHAYYKKMMLRL